MQVDFEDARGEFTHATKPKETSDGERQLKVSAVLTISVPVSFLDKWLEGHNTGAQPSSVFWRDPTPIATENGKVANLYPRYLGIMHMQLGIPANDRLYAFRLRSVPPNGWDGKPREFPGYLEAMMTGCLIKRVKCSTAPNALLLSIAISVDNQEPEIAQTLAELSLCEEIAVDAWLMSRDMVDAMQEGEAKAAAAADADDEEEQEETEAPE